jgi:predicted acyl esterase
MDTRSATPLGTITKNLRRRARPDITVTGPPAGVVLDADVAVPTRDGTVLRANVFRPVAAGRYPVLLCAAPYGKDRMPARTRSGRARPLQYRLASNDAPMTFSAWTSLEAPDPGFWVPRGYVLVVVDLRGWGTSAGIPEPFGPTEGDDVHDCVEWAAEQPWSTGKIGMSGVSYLAISQWTGAATRPPHLAAINPWEGFTDAYRDFSYPGGIAENGFMRVWSAWQKLMRPKSASFRAHQKAHPLRDAWWEQRSPDVEHIDVPALVCGSFSDHSLHSRGSFEGFARLGSEQKWLYTHRSPKWSTYYGPQALAAQTAFFDHFLRGENTGIGATPAVRVEIRDSRTTVAAVRGADRWPPTQARPTVLHLDAVHATLTVDAPAIPATVDVRGALRLRWRFDNEIDLVGPMRLRVPVSAEHADLTLFAGVRKFHDGREVVFEGSYGFTEDLVTRGWLRASHRAVDAARSTLWEAHHPHTATQALHSGEVVDLDLTLLPSATRFAAGDELVLELRDRWFFSAPPLLGQFPAIYAHSPRQRWSVHTGGDHTATLTVPVWTDPAGREIPLGEATAW